jgi:hypothetical protein
MSTGRQHSAATIIVDVLDHITAAWRSGRPEDMADVLDEQVGMAAPGFTAHVVGRQALIDSFATFVREAHVRDYRQGQVRVDGSGGVAVAQYPFEMVYERDGGQWRSKGWDVWVFERRGEKWIAVWRTMQAITEEPAVS